MKSRIFFSWWFCKFVFNIILLLIFIICTFIVTACDFGDDHNYGTTYPEVDVRNCKKTERPEFSQNDTIDIPVEITNYFPQTEGFEFVPGETVTVPIEIDNYSDQAVDKVIVTVLYPNWSFMNPKEDQREDFEYSMSIEPEEVRTFEFERTGR